MKTEARLQSDCYKWFHNTFQHLRGLLYHVPNGELRDPVTASKLKAMGVVRGVPDIVLHYLGQTYFFEFKKYRSGRVSDDQKKMHKKLEQQGFCVWIVDDVNMFKNIISSIIDGKPRQITQALTQSEYFYRHKIFSYLYDMEVSKEYLISDLASEETRDKFITYVAQFISEGFDKLEGFEIVFTDNYDSIYKTYFE